MNEIKKRLDEIEALIKIQQDWYKARGAMPRLEVTCRAETLDWLINQLKKSLERETIAMKALEVLSKISPTARKTASKLRGIRK